jgi:hypothetical protein
MNTDIIEGWSSVYNAFEKMSIFELSLNLTGCSSPQHDMRNGGGLLIIFPF